MHALLISLLLALPVRDEARLSRVEVVIDARTWDDVSASTWLPQGFGPGYLAGPGEVRLCDRLSCVVMLKADSNAGRLPGTVRFGVKPIEGSSLADRLAADSNFAAMVEITDPPVPDLSAPSDSLPLMYFLSEAEFSLPVERIVGLETLFRSAGARVIREGQGLVVEFSSQRLRIMPAWSEPGVNRLSYALRRELPGNPTFRFGAMSRLRFGPSRTATWSF